MKKGHNENNEEVLDNSDEETKIFKKMLRLFHIIP